MMRFILLLLPLLLLPGILSGQDGVRFRRYVEDEMPSRPYRTLADLKSLPPDSIEDLLLVYPSQRDINLLPTLPNLRTLRLENPRLSLQPDSHWNSQLSLDTLSRLPALTELILQTWGEIDSTFFPALLAALSQPGSEKRGEASVGSRVKTLVLEDIRNIDFGKIVTAFPHLRSLTLRNCEYDPHTVESLPELKELGSLTLLGGTCPDQVARLPNLEAFRLESGYFPDSLTGFPRLKVLRVNQFDVRQSYPRWVFSFPDLEEFTITYGENAVIDSELQNLRSLRSLSIYAGSIAAWPWSLEALDTLEALNIELGWYGYLTEFPGPLPLSLRRLSIEGDNIRELPENLSGIESLKELSINALKLERLPDDLERLKNLEILTVKSSLLHHLPESIKNLERLRSLTVDGGMLSSVPDMFDRMDSLRYVRLSLQCDIPVPQSLRERPNVVVDFDCSNDGRGTGISGGLSYAGGAFPLIVLGEWRNEKVMYRRELYAIGPKGVQIAVGVKPYNPVLLGMEIALAGTSNEIGYGSLGLNYYTDFRSVALFAHPEVGLNFWGVEFALGYNIPIMDAGFEKQNGVTFRVGALLGYRPTYGG